MSEVDDLRREMDGKSAAPETNKRVKRPRSGRRPPSAQPPRQKRAMAPERASRLAQDWYDRANSAGFELPYDVNYFALALQQKIERDPEFRRFLARNETGQVVRWVEKMIDRWWSEYVTNDVTQRNAKDFFLVTDWEDVRGYALTCLRAAYLKEHGRVVQPPEYPNQREFREEYTRIGATSRVEALTDSADMEVTRSPELDAKRREALRSWRERKAKK